MNIYIFYLFPVNTRAICLSTKTNYIKDQKQNIILDFVVIDNESESLGNSIHTGKNPWKCEPLYVNCAMSETKRTIKQKVKTSVVHLFPCS
jgi:hypothetical protein